MNTEQILSFLQVDSQPLTLSYLDELLAAYVQRVPWESASRLSQQVTTPNPLQRARTAMSFWQNAMTRGTGGTCFESNGALFALLQEIGFEGYLTINDMGEQRACHTSCIILLDGRKWLVDAGYPLYVPICLDPDGPMSSPHPIHDFTATPVGGNRYEITRSRHPEPYIFTLIDEPVKPIKYHLARRNDYLPAGNFNKELIIRILKGNDTWVYNGSVDPPVLESFTIENGREEHPFAADIPEQLNQIFQIETSLLRLAFEVLDRQKDAA